MLKKLKIKRFKSARDVELEFGAVNLFIGGNGSGKSNLLEAIGVIAAALSRGLTDGDFLRKGVRLTPPALMKSAFKNLELPKTLRLEVELENNVSYALELTGRDTDTHLTFFTEKCQQNGKQIFGRSGRGIKVLGQSIDREIDKFRSVWDQMKNAFDFDETLYRELETISQYAIYAPQTEFLRGLKVGAVDHPPVGLHGEGLPGAVRSFLSLRHRIRRLALKNKKYSPEHAQLEDAVSLVWLPGWARQYEVGKLAEYLRSSQISDAGSDMVYFIDRYMHEKRNKLSVYDSSEGTLFLLFVAILLGHEESPKIFALDNVDNALNPRLTRELIATIIRITKRKTSENTNLGPNQIFLTSHNPTSLDAFDLFDDDQRVFVVKRDDSGRTVAVRLKPRDNWTRKDWEKAKSGRNLSDLWISGDIAGALGQ